MPSLQSLLVSNSALTVPTLTPRATKTGTEMHNNNINDTNFDPIDAYKYYLELTEMKEAGTLICKNEQFMASDAMHLVIRQRNESILQRIVPATT